MTKKNNKDDYLDSFIEYQDKQYLPGYYVGGNIHPAYKSKTKALAYFLLFEGTFSIISALVILILSTQFKDQTDIYTILSAILIITLGVFSIIAAKRILKKNPKNNK